MSFSKKELAGAGPSLCPPTDVALRQTKRVPAGYPAGEYSFIIKEALHLCMDIHIHGFLAGFIFFIHMQIQVQALKHIKMDSKDYII